MMINKENYELFAIDYLENNLDKETSAEMIRFLNDHPDIQAELELMKSPVVLISDHTITFEPKSLLKKEEQQKALWIPIFVKYAAAIALLLSVASVWHLNNQQSFINNSVATTDTINSNLQNKTTTISDPVKENTTIADSNKPKPQPTQTQTQTQTQITNNNNQSPKQINKPIKEILVLNKDENEIDIATIIPVSSSNPINENNTLLINEIESASNEDVTISKRIELSLTSVDLFAQTDSELSNGSIGDGINLGPAPIITIDKKDNNPKGSWILNALTKKSNGTNIFAFEGIKRALTPTRLRDVNVDKASTDSPFKQFTHD